MKRIIPVLLASIIVNGLLFLMMNQMVSGKKQPPEKRAHFRGIELVHFQAPPEAAPEKNRETRKLPAFQKPAALKALAKPTIKPEPKPAQKTQPVSEPAPKAPKPIAPEPILLEPALEKNVAEPLLLSPPPLPSPAVELPLVQEAKLEDVPPKPTPTPAPAWAIETVLPKTEPDKKDTVEDLEFAKDWAAEEPKEVELAESNSEASDDLISPSPPQKVEVAVAESVLFPEEASPGEAFETDVRPLFRIPPHYPRRAVRARLEGMVRVAFTITKNGSVQDPFVVESAPEKVFDQAALRAIRKWKFSPKQSSGKAVARRAVQNIRFSLKKAE